VAAVESQRAGIRAFADGPDESNAEGQGTWDVEDVGVDSLGEQNRTVLHKGTPEAG